MPFSCISICLIQEFSSFFFQFAKLFVDFRSFSPTRFIVLLPNSENRDLIYFNSTTKVILISSLALLFFGCYEKIKSIFILTFSNLGWILSLVYVQSIQKLLTKYPICFIESLRHYLAITAVNFFFNNQRLAYKTRVQLTLAFVATSGTESSHLAIGSATFSLLPFPQV